jgi:hypothetical protein
MIIFQFRFLSSDGFVLAQIKYFRSVLGIRLVLAESPSKHTLFLCKSDLTTQGINQARDGFGS